MTTDKTGAETTVTDNPELQRFEIALDPEGTVGFALYRDRDGAEAGAQRIFFHTEVDEAYGGRGLGTILVRGAIDATRAAGRRVVPVCPLFAAYVGKHDDVADIVDQPDVHVMRYLREHAG